MRILRFNESLESKKSFSDIEPSDLIYMTREQIIDLISNTFESEVIDDNPEWTIVKSKWVIIHKDNEMTKLSMKDILDIEEYVYFHIFPDDYTIIRGNSESLSAFLKKANSVSSKIRTDGGTEGKSMILKGSKFYEMLYSLHPIPRGEEGAEDEDGNWHGLNSMSCGGDIRLDGKKISYYSDLLIGSQVEMDHSIKKKHPGLTKREALLKDAEERARPTLVPKILKTSKDSGIYKGTPEYKDYQRFLTSFQYEDMVLSICDGLEKRSTGEYYFKKPKHFEKMKFHTHEYEPADVYYGIRISEIQDTDSQSESFTFQWFGRLFANEQHLQNYYKKYPHFGPGGKMHTYKRGDGVEALSYQPPMYKDVNSIFGYDGDVVGSTYYCEDRDALFMLLEQFNDFMKDESQSHFETDYPNFKT